MQYAIRAVRAAQLSAAGFYFFGAQIFGKLGRQPPQLLQKMQENKLLAAGGVYGLDVVAQTFKSINAFEVTYNGQLLHSKLATGAFPDTATIAAKLREVMAATEGEGGDDPTSAGQHIPRDEL